VRPEPADRISHILGIVFVTSQWQHESNFSIVKQCSVAALRGFYYLEKLCRFSKITPTGKLTSAIQYLPADRRTCGSILFA
jgi:hypothetical protein